MIVKRVVPAVCLILLVSLSVCGETMPPQIMEIYEKADDNGEEISEAYFYYLVDYPGMYGFQDSLKWSCASFLLANMEGHGYATYKLLDTAGSALSFDILVFPNFDSLMLAVDSIEDVRGTIEFQRDTIIYDIDVISSEYLVENIDLAVEAWRSRPWARSLAFSEFRDYVLPYRGSNEPIESFRREFMDRYSDLPSRMKDSTSPIEAASLINEDLRSWFKFDERYYFHPTDQGVSEMIKSGMGRCEDMTNLTIYALRANGIAVTSDYTPYWANAGNNHAWNAIVTPDGNAIPFMGAEANPGEYTLWNKFAKVYRKMFAIEQDCLALQPNRQTSLPRWLAGKNYKDVTSEYTHAVDVTVPLIKPAPDSVDIAYICVFNDGEWQPIHWGRIVNDTVLFTNMNTDVLYLPALYLNEEIIPWGFPFLLDSSDGADDILPSSVQTSVTLLSTTRPELVASTIGVDKTGLITDHTYELRCWIGDQWQALGEKTALGSSLTFESIPENALLWLIDVDGREEERPFRYQHSRQVWY